MIDPFRPYESLAEKNDREVREIVEEITRKAALDDDITFDSNIDSDGLPWDQSYCGVYWIITTCLTAIAIGIWLGMVLWLISGEHR